MGTFKTVFFLFSRKYQGKLFKVILNINLKLSIKNKYPLIVIDINYYQVI